MFICTVFHKSINLKKFITFLHQYDTDSFHFETFLLLMFILSFILVNNSPEALLHSDTCQQYLLFVNTTFGRLKQASSGVCL